MLRVLCVNQLAVTIEDLYFVDPAPAPGMEGHERGVRLELRLLEQQPRHGSVYSSPSLLVGRSVWRADFLESVAGGPGSRDRMHFHSGMLDGEPGERTFSADLTDDPMGWLHGRLSDAEALLTAAKVDAAAYAESTAALREVLAEIMATTERTLEDVRAGRLATAPGRP